MGIYTQTKCDIGTRVRLNNICIVTISNVSNVLKEMLIFYSCLFILSKKILLITKDRKIIQKVDMIRPDISESAENFS